jgi:hypothetical protein
MSLAIGTPNPRFAAAIQDDTGKTETVTTAGTPNTLLSETLFLQVLNTLPSSAGSPGFLWDPATGLLTLVGALMAGKYKATFTPARTIGTNAGVKIFRIAKGSTASGVQSRDVSAATAVETSQAPAIAYLDLVAGDTVKVLVDVGTNGHAVTVRAGTLEVERVG